MQAIFAVRTRPDMLKNIIRFSLIILIVSCNNEPETPPVGKDIYAMIDSMRAADSLSKVRGIAADTLGSAPLPADDENFTNYPLDGYEDNAADDYPSAILETGQFHKDEVKKKTLSRNWYGVFKNNDGYYVENTRIITERVLDAVLDESEDNPTGWKVSTPNSDTALLLFTSTNTVEKRQIKEVTLSQHEIKPGESITYTSNGITYTLYATGEKYKQDPNDDFYYTRNYRLFIKATINGTERTQLLVASKSFDDAMVKLLFAGDIDGDNMPDLIIDVSNHYNVDAPALYLSKPAGDKEVLQLVGWHMTMGC